MDEYISREAVLKAFKLIAKNPNKDYQRGMQDAIDCLVPEVIADIPAADVQPVKHGEWEYIRNVKLSGTIKLCECNQCHNKIFGGLSYCGNCGAKMDGDQDD